MPNPRSPAEERQALADLRRWMKARPTDALLVGLVGLRDRAQGYQLDMAFVNFEPIHFVAAADALLERAEQRMAPLAAVQPQVTENLMMVQKARAALAFVAPGEADA